MPNWCNNNLSIAGPRVDRQRFLALTMEGSETDTRPAYNPMRLHPTPGPLTDTVHGGYTSINGNLTREQLDLELKQDENLETYGHADWYSWNIENWGTKWSVSMHRTSDDDSDEETFHFESAWAPPVELFDKIATQFPTLDFLLSYDEPGSGFVGAVNWKNGAKVADEYVDLSRDKRYLDALDEDPDWERDLAYEVMLQVIDECVERVQNPKKL